MREHLFSFGGGGKSMLSSECYLKESWPSITPILSINQTIGVMLGHRSKVIRPFGDLLQACWGPPPGDLQAYGSLFFLAFFPTIITIEPRCLGTWIGFLACRFKWKRPNLDQPLSERVRPIVPKQSTHTAKEWRAISIDNCP